MRRPALSLITVLTLLLCVLGISMPAQAQAPVISGVFPFSAPIGGQIILFVQNVGNYQGTSTVTVDGISAVVETALWSPAYVYAEVPPGATKGEVVITVDGVKSNSQKISIVAAPSITSLSPSSGPIGTSITITGNNLNPLTAGNVDGGASFYETGGCSYFDPTAYSCGVTALPTSESDTSMV